jgi:hypothetical protein
MSPRSDSVETARRRRRACLKPQSGSYLKRRGQVNIKLKRCILDTPLISVRIPSKASIQIGITSRAGCHTDWCKASSAGSHIDGKLDGYSPSSL